LARSFAQGLGIAAELLTRVVRRAPRA
jgi:hypothetical protein